MSKKPINPFFRMTHQYVMDSNTEKQLQKYLQDSEEELNERFGDDPVGKDFATKCRNQILIGIWDLNEPLNIIYLPCYIYTPLPRWSADNDKYFFSTQVECIYEYKAPHTETMIIGVTFDFHSNEERLRATKSHYVTICKTFAVYLFKTLSNHPNFHKLKTHLIDYVENPQLHNVITQITLNIETVHIKPIASAFAEFAATGAITW